MKHVTKQHTYHDLCRDCRALSESVYQQVLEYLQVHQELFVFCFANTNKSCGITCSPIHLSQQSRNHLHQLCHETKFHRLEEGRLKRFKKMRQKQNTFSKMPAQRQALERN